MNTGLVRRAEVVDMGAEKKRAAVAAHQWAKVMLFDVARGFAQSFCGLPAL